MNKRKDNLFSKLRANRKGVLDIPLIELIYLIVAVAIILFLVYLAFTFYSFFKEGKEHESTVNNLKVLAGNINSMIKEDEKLVTRTIPYYISGGGMFEGDTSYILVGFNYNSEFTATDCENKKIEPPTLCKGRSCLCIYGDKKDNADFSNNEVPLECEDFNQKIVFLAPFDDKNNLDNFGDNFKGSALSNGPTHYASNYEYLVLYGRGGCATKAVFPSSTPTLREVSTKDTKFNVRTIYLEKYTEGDKNYIFIAKYKEDISDAIYKRKNALESKYGTDKAS